ncbi:MAG: glycosyltransferase family 1 protein, partial [Gluconacetobacter sp.]
GIQRVQSEVIRAAISRAEGTVGVCVYAPESQSWSHIPNELFLNLLESAEQGTNISDKAWQEQFQKFRAFLSLSGDMPFPKGSSIVSLGAGWHLRSFFQKISELKKKFDVQHIAMIHDLIPLFKPEYFVDSLVSDFKKWMGDLLVTSDKIMTVSAHTKSDLERYREISGIKNQKQDTYVVPLDVAIPLNENPEGRASPFTLDVDLPEEFVLFVSTFEIRKGHLLAAQAWKRLIARYGERTPNLLCIGSRGWKADAFWKFMSKNPDVAKKIIIIEKATDSFLFHAYKKCIFTIYPSHYEGWGLPVVESLCLGKVPVVSNNSSLPEAGGKFALYFQTGDAVSLSEAVEKLAFHSSLRHRMEHTIAEEFSPRSWGDVADQIILIATTKPEGALC